MEHEGGLSLGNSARSGWDSGTRWHEDRGPGQLLLLHPGGHPWAVKAPTWGREPVSSDGL